MKPEAVRPAALKRSWYTTVSGRKEESLGGSSLAQMVVKSTVSPSVAMTAPPACRPTRPVSSRTSESPRRNVQLSAAGSAAPPASATAEAAVRHAQWRRLTPARGRACSPGVATPRRSAATGTTLGAARAAKLEHLRRVVPAQPRITLGRSAALCILPPLSPRRTRALVCAWTAGRYERSADVAARQPQGTPRTQIR